MKHIATVPAALVKAAMLFQAKQDVRFYLNGIYITQDHIVATNGHAMFVSLLLSTAALSSLVVRGYQPGVRYPVRAPMQIPACRQIVGLNPDFCTSGDPNRPGKLGIFNSEGQ